MSDERQTTPSNAVASASIPSTEAASPSFIDAKRRGFLQGAVIAGGAAASGSALAHHGGDHELVPDVAEPTPSGYRETDHVRAYYATARS